MKTIIKIFFTLSFLFIATQAAVASTQFPDDRVEQNRPPRHPNNKRFSPEQFCKDLGAYIAREAGMSPSEAKAFMPVFLEMKDKQRAIERQKANAISKAATQNMSEKDCKRILNDINELSKKAQRIEVQYQQRLVRIVGTQKFIKAIHAERNFGRSFFRKITR